MRLTLRTLLAYMDDILDPSDHEELGRKIEASPFATELIHRTRDAVRRLRLSAPEPLPTDADDVHGADPNLDANVAAEYLDNTLPPDDVAEFERHCLEAGPNADMLLAEAASCHHVLTLVLGEPAEVDADLRQRMYGIVEHSGPEAPQQLRIEPAHRSPQPAEASVAPEAPVAAATLAAAAPVAPAADADETAVPDYLLEAARVRRAAQRRLVAALILAAVMGGGAAAWFMRGGVPAVPDDVASATRDIDAETLDADSLVGATDAADAGAMTAATADAAAGSDAPAFTPGTAESAAPPFGGETVIETTPPADEAPPAGAAPVAIVPGAADLALPPTAADDGLVDDAPADGGPAVVDDGAVLDDLAPADPTAPGALTAGGSLPPAMPTPPGDDAPAVDPLDALRVDPAPPRDTAATGVVDQAELDEALAAAVGGSLVLDDDADDADEPTADEPQQLGAYVGADDLLLRRDPQTGVWRRLPARSTLAPGDRLLVLPLFRTEVVVGSAGRLMLAGGSEATLLSPSEAGDRRADFGLAIPFGRVVLHAGPSGQRVALIVGDQTRMVTLGGASSLAIDVRRLFVPGHDAEREPYPLAATFYLTSGSAEWNDGVQDRSAAGQATWALADSGDGDPTDIGDLPAWISAEPLTGIDRAARDAVYRALAPGEPVSVPLLELSDPRGQGQKLEVRGLAFRSGTYIGQFEPLVKSLADLGDRPRWKERIETLRQAIARDPAALPAIAQALAVQRGEKSVSDLLLMLVGFNSQDVGVTREEVQNGAMVRLINWMDHEDLAYRVLAIHNLNEITGTSYLGGYRPEHLASKRKVGIRFYTDRMERGELRPQTWLPTGWGPR